MGLTSNVILGAGFPGSDASDEGKIIGVKNDEYVAFPFISVIEFEEDSGTYTSKKTAGEILDLARSGAYLVGRCVIDEDTVYQFGVIGVMLNSGTYVVGVNALSADYQGTASNADDPIVFSTN